MNAHRRATAAPALAIRRATLADASRLSAFAEAAFRAAFAAQNAPEDMDSYLAGAFGSERQVEEIADAGADVPLVEAAGAATDAPLLGYAHLVAGRSPQCVTGAAHGRGVAPALMTATLAAARARGAATLWLGVWEHNARAIAFYRKQAFERVGEQRFVLGTDVQTDWVMARALDAPLKGSLRLCHAVSKTIQRGTRMRRYVALLFGACFASGAAAAAPPAPAAPPAAEAPLLGGITVTGTRLRSTSPGTVVVGVEDFERFDQQRLKEALATLPGLTPTPGARGSARAESRVYLRGFDGLQTPFLVDGVPFYVSWDGEPTDLDRFTLFDLAAVEVAKGYTSVAYGPGTLGGAINLVTRRPTGPLEANFTLGTHADGADGWRADANVGTRRGAWYAQLGGSWLERDGWDLPQDFRPAGTPVTAPLQGNLQPAGERLRSYARDRKASAKIGYVTDDGSEYALAAYDQRADKGVPPYAGAPDANQRFNYFDWPHWNKRGVYFLGQTAIADGVTLRTRAYYDEFANRLYSYDGPTYSTQATPRAFRSEYDDHSTGGSLVLDARLGPGTATVAAHLRNDFHSDIQTFPTRTPGTLRFADRTWSLGAEYRAPLGPRLQAAAAVSRDARDARRAEDQNRAGASFALDEQSATNAQAQLVHAASGDDELRASVARRARVPSQFERYSYRLGAALPNPGLELERATTLELGWQRRSATHRVDAAVFQSRLTDLIQPVTVSPGVTQNRNVGSARYTGAELGVTVEPVASLSAGVNYTWVNRESRSTPKRVLFGVPRHAAFAWAEWRPLEALTVVPSLTVNSRRLTSDLAAAGGEPVGGFATLDLRIGWRFLERYRAELVGRNLADRLYSLDYGYPREGRSVAFVLRGNW